MAKPLDIVRTIADLRARVAAWRAEGYSVGLVPTMGALHAGHLALVKAAVRETDRVVASLFVNPAQFGPNEDLDKYPRHEAEDAAKFQGEGGALLFAPPVEEVYPDGFATTITVSGLTEGLCGAARPGHFEGVATVVSKLLLQCVPDRAYFGEKDYQQLQVIKRMTRDLDIPVTIVGVPTVREVGGLALSSRNEYLSPAQRDIALNLNRVLRRVADSMAEGADAKSQVAWGVGELRKAGFDEVDYLEVCDAETLEPLHIADRPARVLAAARLGGIRLIDNVVVPES